MKERLLNILKTGSVSSGLIICRNDDEKIYLKRYLAQAPVSKTGQSESSVRPGTLSECSVCRGVIERKKPFGSGINGVMVLLNAPALTSKMEIDFYRAESAELLKKMISSIGLVFAECYITNLVKCETTDPLVKPSDMVRNCLPIFKSEIETVKPKIIIVMGEIVPLQPVVNTTRGISWFNTEHSISLVKNPDLKRPAWETLKLVKTKLQELEQ
ncbi:MAG TPA: uracil-DNA glycosylase family protein [Spirochaetota bacterium]|nr:uracil-DNA glycosylase family protein [Spirochaetota bacterium]